MPRMYHKHRVYRTKFRRLPRGGDYWPIASIASAPRIKANSVSYINGYTVSTGALITAAELPNATVARVHPVFLGQRTMR